MTIEVAKITTELLENPPLRDNRIADALYISSASALVKNLWGEKELHGACKRAQFYRMTGTTPDEPRRKTRQAEYGDLISDFEADLAKRAGIYLAHEFSIAMVKRGIPIRGRADLLCEVTTPNNNKQRIGVEYKSIGNYQAKRGTIITPKGVKYFPKLAHAFQAAIYLDYLKDYDFDHFQIIYIDRGTGEISIPSHKVFLTPDGEISINGEMIGVNVEDIYKRFEEVYKAVSSDKIPDREYEIEYSKKKLQTLSERGLLSKTDREAFNRGKLKKGDSWCSYCEFRERCWETKEDDNSTRTTRID